MSLFFSSDGRLAAPHRISAVARRPTVLRTTQWHIRGGANHNFVMMFFKQLTNFVVPENQNLGIH